MNVKIPANLETLCMLHCLGKEDRIIILEALNDEEMLRLSHEIISFKELLIEAVKEEIMSMLDCYNLQQLQAYDDVLCSAARARVETLLPADKTIFMAGENVEYSCFFHCIDLKNKMNYKPNQFEGAKPWLKITRR